MIPFASCFPPKKIAAFALAGMNFMIPRAICFSHKKKAAGLAAKLLFDQFTKVFSENTLRFRHLGRSDTDQQASCRAAWRFFGNPLG